jgi:hypothetical protein
MGERTKPNDQVGNLFQSPLSPSIYSEPFFPKQKRERGCFEFSVFYLRLLWSAIAAAITITMTIMAAAMMYSVVAGVLPGGLAGGGVAETLGVTPDETVPITTCVSAVDP